MIDREELVVDASGARKWFSSTKVPVRDDNGIFGLVGIATTLIISEPEKRVAAGTAEREGKIADFAASLGPLPHWLRETLVFVYGAIVCPFLDFFVRYRWHAVTLLALTIFESLPDAS